MASDDLQLQLEGKTYDISEFELGELEWIEEEMGCPLDQIDAGSIKAATRFVTVIKRRDNPDFTIEDARKLKLSIFDAPDEQPATNGNGSGATARPTRGAKAKTSGAAAKR